MGRPKKTGNDMSTWRVGELRTEIQRLGLPSPGSWIKKAGLVRLIKETKKQQQAVEPSEPVPNSSERPSTTTRGSSAGSEAAAATPESSSDASEYRPRQNNDRLTQMEDNLNNLASKLGTLTEAMAAFVGSGSQTLPTIAAPSGASLQRIAAQGIPRDVIGLGNTGVTTASFWERDAQHHGESCSTTNSSSSTTTSAASSRQALMGKGVASHNVPRVALVSPQLRNDILSGKDINLARLLIPDSEGFHQREIVISGGEAIPVRQRTDPRLLKNLNLSEFIKSFTIYKDVMVEGYPHRADELTIYLNEIIDMANDYGGTTFYQYHKHFSARAAALLLNHNTKVDWSIRDNDLYCKLFAGRRANSCSLCSSMAHATDFCPLSVYSAKQSQPLKRPYEEGHSGYKSSTSSTHRSKRQKYDTMGNGQEICIHFNTKGCSRGPSCPYAHACLACKSEHHSKSECVQAQNGRTQSSHTQATNPHQKTEPHKTNAPNKYGKSHKQ